MRRMRAAIAIAAPTSFVTATVADASILFFMPKPKKPGQFTLDDINTPSDVFTKVNRRQSGGTSSGLGSYNVVLGDSFIFQEPVTTAVTTPLTPIIPTIPKPNLPTKPLPPSNNLPPMGGGPEKDLPPIVEDKDPVIPVVDDDKDPVDPPIVDVTDLAEPGSLGLLGFVLAGLGMFAYRRKTT